MNGRFEKGHVPHNKRPDVYKSCPQCQVEFFVPKNNPSTKFCGRKCWAQSVKGVPKSIEHRANIKANHARHWKGKPLSPERRKAAALNFKPYQSGEKHWNWKGGITPLLKKLRFTNEYSKWRTAVFERDNYTCQNCERVGGNLHADHIIPYAYLIHTENWDLLYDIDNGNSLCAECHKQTSTYGVRAGSYA